MGDVFLRPMMDNLNSKRGPVSTIFGILPAVTLSAGEKLNERELSGLTRLIFRTDCNDIYEQIWLSKGYNRRCFFSCCRIFYQLSLGEYLVLLSCNRYHWRYNISTKDSFSIEKFLIV